MKDLLHSLKEGLTLEELRHLSGSRFQDSVPWLYDQWRSGNLKVLRFSENSSSRNPVPYSNRAFFLPDDQVQFILSAESSHQTVATWNVNSIRIRLPLLLEWLQDKAPDIVCLQETKVEDHQFPVLDLQSAGYHSVYCGQKSYNGVAILSRLPIDEVHYGFRDGFDASEKRMIRVRIGKLHVINLYVPQGQTPDSPKFAYKQEFLNHVLDEIQQNYSPEASLLVAGDYNIAPDHRDLTFADQRQGMVSFHPVEHAWLKKLESWGLKDLFRKHHAESGLYSWWDFRTRGFEKNDGMRIDHLWGTASVLNGCESSMIDVDVRHKPQPSDHAPVLCTLNLP
ncbi:MAG: exodeoxyribonuclease III [SAR324 cluster bacterium]|nr:exodeoxyribonuclease III [SAR324 cluster bacterium]